MNNQHFRTPHKTKCFTLMRHRDGVLVADRLAERCYIVQITGGRFVGPCSCGSTATDPWHSCRHQNAVRTYLMDYCFRKREYGLAEDG